MPEKLEDLAKEITIEDIAKMGPWEKCKYYSFEWVFNTVWWPGWLGGPAGTFVYLYFARSNSELGDIYSPAGMFRNILLPFLGGAMIASAGRVSYNILRDGRIIKKIRDGTYEPKKARR